MKEQEVNESEKPENKEEQEKQEPAKELSPEEKLAELNDKYMRLYADFENFRKRTTKERIDLIRFAGEEVLKNFIPVLDDFDRAMKAMQSSSADKELIKGVELIFHKLKKTMEDRGVKEMNAAGTEFNADLHEAVANVPAEKEEMKGKVIEETEKGYYLNEKVLRYAKVVVAN